MRGSGIKQNDLAVRVGNDEGFWNVIENRLKQERLPVNLGLQAGVGT